MNKDLDALKKAAAESPKVGDHAAKAKSRVVVSGNLYFQRASGGNYTIPTRYAKWVEQDVPQDALELLVTQLWKGFAPRVETPGMAVIANMSAGNLHLKPSAEELKELATIVIEVGIIPAGDGKPRDMYSTTPKNPDPIPFALLAPGDDLRITATDLSRIRVRCRNKQAKCLVTVFPA